ncbi:hypothetical protein [Andreprevotia chitinilytica]|uniref:hypothetical protein n=1 Tax=Andreprevotia chitinilytica TaxID=396808 RepID=UPI0005513B22|nr:hypothetical protein [Andreprevotia chitinilytica]
MKQMARKPQPHQQFKLATPAKERSASHAAAEALALQINAAEHRRQLARRDFDNRLDAARDVDPLFA